ENIKICYPIRINMRIKIELNKKEFIIRTVVNTNDGMKPGYIYEEDNDAMIYSTPSEVVNENYKKIFDKATRYPGPSILGFDDKIFIEQLQVNVLFFPFEIVTNGIKVFVAALGSSDEKKLNFAGSGYCSSFHYRYSGKKSLICQSINDKNCQIDIYFQGKIVYTQTGITPTDVWEKLPIVKGTDGKELFGLCDQLVIQAIKKHIDAPYCTSSHWDNIEIMTNAFKRCLKKKISVVNVDWLTKDIVSKNNTQSSGTEFELEKGWALKSKQRFGIRGKGKRITKNVKSYLEGYFLSGNVNKSNRMTASEMVSELQILANEGEIQVEDIPEVATVANWITRYAASLKKLSAQKVEESIKNNQNNSAIIGVIDINQGEKIGSSGSIDIYEKDDSQGLSEEPNVHLK
ncbi:1315_t:CDS:2, partial [Entrophospora sp. SA101]